MSAWDDWKAEAEKLAAEAKAEEQKLVNDIAAYYKELTDKANQAAIDAREEGVPIVHPDQQDSLTDPVPVHISAQQVAPGSKDQSVVATAEDPEVAEEPVEEEEVAEPADEEEHTETPVAPELTAAPGAAEGV